MADDYDSGQHYPKKPVETAAFTTPAEITTQLPSSLAMHGGTMSLTRRKLTERKKPGAVDNEVINMVPISEIQEHPDNAPKAINGVAIDAMTDMLEYTYKDLDKLKEMTCSMKQKKQLRRTILDQYGETQGKSWSSRGNVRWKRFKEDYSEVVRQATLWRSSIHEVEGRFGNGVRSYFSFLRWLFLLNVYIFLLIFIFVAVPTIVFENLRDSNITISSQLNTANNVSTNCSYTPYNGTEVAPFSQYIIWWFTGQGFMENTLLFIGYYDNAATTVQSGSAFFYYNVPLAYILVAFGYFLLSLILLVRRAALGLKQTLVSDEDRFYTYCNKVFAGWDYCITDERAAKLKQSSLKYELQTDLEEERIKERQANRTRNEKIRLYIKRFFVNFLVIIILGGCLAGIFFAAQYSLQKSSTYDDQFFLDLLVTYLTSIVITAVNFIAPILFALLIPLEDYSPAFAIQFTLVRTVFLRLASVIFLYIVVYFQIYCQRYPNLNVEGAFNEECGFCAGMQCWETYLGQEMYKLTVLDFFIVVGVTLFVEFPRKLIVTHCDCGLAKWWGQQEFSIPENVLDIVYAQTVAWIGAFYAPLLPVILVIKFFIFFYLKKLTLLYNCRPATRPYRSSKSGTFFFIILLVGFAVAAVPVAVGMAIIKPSADCGPFRGWNTMFYSVTLAITTTPQWLQDIFWFIGSAGCAVIVGVILCLALYYYTALSSAHKKMIRLLKEQLTLEGKDKQFLLERVNKLTDRLGAAGGWGEADQPKIETPPASSRSGGMVNRGFTDSPHDSLPGQADSEDENA